MAGEAVDSALFYPLAFYNSGHHAERAGDPADVHASSSLKTCVEVAFLPVTYRIVAFLKRAENEDYYDRDTDFNPFKLET